MGTRAALLCQLSDILEADYSAVMIIISRSLRKVHRLEKCTDQMSHDGVLMWGPHLQPSLTNFPEGE